VPFTLTYEADRIQDGRRYALEARITNGETLLFITATHYAVFTGGPDKTDLVLTRVGGAQASVPPVPPPSPEGDWRAVSIGGTPVAQGIESTLSITKAGEVSGKGGCNSFGGRASVDGVRLSFGAMRSTMMACAGPAMAQERAFLDALAATGRFGIADGQLVLMTETSAPLAVLERR
jgi:putative lipoprotein